MKPFVMLVALTAALAAAPVLGAAYPGQTGEVDRGFFATDQHRVGAFLVACQDRRFATPHDAFLGFTDVVIVQTSPEFGPVKSVAALHLGDGSAAFAGVHFGPSLRETYAVYFIRDGPDVLTCAGLGNRASPLPDLVATVGKMLTRPNRGTGPGRDLPILADLPPGFAEATP